MYTKPIERMVRMFVAQKLDLGYIRHYLEEEYQLDPKTIEVILERTGAKPDPASAKAKPGPAADAKVKRQDFF